MEREKLSLELQDLVQELNLLTAVYQNPLSCSEETAEEFKRVLINIEEKYNKVKTNVIQYLDTTVVNEQTEMGRINILIKKLHEEIISNLYFDNKYVEARNVEREVETLFNSVLNSTYEQPNIKELISKYSYVYNVYNGASVKEKEEVKEVEVEDVPIVKPMSIEEIKRTTFFIVGTQTHKLIPLDVDKEEHLKKLKAKLYVILKKMIKQGMNNFVTGGSRGFEDLALDVLEDLKTKFPQIKINILVPYKKYGEYWKKDEYAKFKAHLNKADNVKILIKSNVTNVSTSEAIALRNSTLLNLSHCGLITMYNGLTGTPKEVFDLAKKQKIQTFVLNPLTFEIKKSS